MKCLIIAILILVSSLITGCYTTAGLGNSLTINGRLVYGSKSGETIDAKAVREEFLLLIEKAVAPFGYQRLIYSPEHPLYKYFKSYVSKEEPWFTVYKDEKRPQRVASFVISREMVEANGEEYEELDHISIAIKFFDSMNEVQIYLILFKTLTPTPRLRAIMDAITKELKARYPEADLEWVESEAKRSQLV